MRDADILWAVQSGLGSLLRRLVAADSPITRSLAWPSVLGADLASRVQWAAQRKAVEEILDACRGRIPPPTLLKGISLCDEAYPAAHVRPMRDIDLLVGVEYLPDMERLLLLLGYYQPSSPASYVGHHHLSPFTHPRTGVWVEIHHALFRPLTALGADPVFSPTSLKDEQRASRLGDRPVFRLSAELQVVYLAAHWAASHKLITGPGGLMPMLDVTLLLHRGGAFRWPLVLDWLGRSAASPAVHLLLAYLDQHGIIALDRQLLEEIRRRSRFRPVDLHLAFKVIDRYVVEGRQRRLMRSAALRVLWDTLLTPRPLWRRLVGIPSILRGPRSSR